MLVDENHHVDREAAARAGVGFYGKNTMLITRRHGSLVALGTLVTDVELEPAPPLALDCGSCTLCIDACPTGRAGRAGRARRDALPLVRRRSGAADPRGLRGSRSSDGVYGCDICQDVCPWNRGVEKRRDDARPARPRRAARVARDWLEADAAELRARYGASTCRAATPLPAPQRAGRARQPAADEAERIAVEPYLDDGDEMLREHAAWALSRIEARDGL